MPELNLKRTTSTREFVPGFRWDTVWKLLLSWGPNQVGRTLRRILLSSEFSNASFLNFTLDESVSKDDSDGSPFILAVQDEEYVTHFELCREDKKNIVRRAFVLALSKATPVSTPAGLVAEGYGVPEAHIIDLKHVLQDSATQTLLLYEGFVANASMGFNVHVSHPDMLIPCLRRMMSCRTVGEARKYARDFYSKLTNGADAPNCTIGGSALENKDTLAQILFRLCAVLTTPQVWEAKGTSYGLLDLITAPDSSVSASVLETPLTD